MTLMTEIETVQRAVNTDSYQMSVGEITNLYRDGELIINPIFQRLFRWNDSQKSKLIESILIGIPLPSIFVYETTDGKWELVDGLQRISTLLEFMGLLTENNGDKRPPSSLEATKYLPSLHNVVWEKNPDVPELPEDEQEELPKNLQLAIRRSRISVEILKRPSDAHTKYDLFQRLNGGGSIANPQELRNCVIVMVNEGFFQRLKTLSEWPNFSRLLQITEDQRDNQRDLEYLSRLLVYEYVEYDGRLDVEEYIDNGIIKIAEEQLLTPAGEQAFRDTFDLLHDALGDDALKQYSDGAFRGRVGLTALEIVAVGVFTNLDVIKALPGRNDYLIERVRDLWLNEEVRRFSRPGLRGTQRIRRTIPFGNDWFRPAA
jgi:hypothetical protein